MKKILIVAKISEFKNENSSNRYFFLKYLSEKPNIMLLDDIDTTSLDIWLKSKYNVFRPDIIIYYFLSRGDRFMNISIKDFKTTIKKIKKVPTAMIFEDSHYTEMVNRLYKNNGFDYFIQLGNNTKILDALKQYNIPYKVWNQYIDLNKFKNYDVEKEYDFLFYGHVDPNIYPLRTRIYNVLQEILYTNPEIKVKIIKHGSYDKNVLDLPTQEDLSILLSKSRFSFATTSMYDLFLKKYIEIPLSGATIIGNIPTDYHQLLNDKVIVIKDDYSFREIKQILLDAYNNKYFKVEINSTDLSRNLRSNYGYETGYNDLNNIVDNILVSLYGVAFVNQNNYTNATGNELNLYIPIKRNIMFSINKF